MKIRAGALQFVLFIGVVIAILLLTFVLLSHSHSLFGRQTERLVQTVKQADMGLSLALKTVLPLGDTIPIPLNVDDAIQVKGIREYWGIYEKFTVIAASEKHQFKKTALIGHGISEDFPALYLQDNDRPMIIVGRAKITGDAFLPKQGIRAGNISGNSYYHNSLVYGQQRQSTKSMPGLHPELRTYIQQLTQNAFAGRSNDIRSLSNGTTLRNSFNDATVVIQGGQMDLSGVRLTGNIIVRASRKITVNPSSILEDVILLAPEIEIKDGVKGSFQAIASNSINTGTGCELAYPSALVVYKDRPPAAVVQRPNIHIKSNTHIRGAIISLGNFKEQQFYPQIKMEEKATLLGELYCEQNLELKGHVTGRVNTAAFMALENGSIYQNHLYQGTIDRSLLPLQYAGLLYETPTPYKTVSKWLY